MNKILIFFILALLIFPFVSASCSLGANPLSININAKPGQEVMINWNFYNLYGNRITHVVVNKLEGPDWKIRYDPEIHEAKYDISGVVEKVQENLALENNQVVLEIPYNLQEGINYVKHPNQDGYIPVKTVKIYITIPEDAKLWKNYDFVFESKGSCFSEPGAVIPAVATKLKLSIKTTTTFYETPIANETEKPQKSTITGAVVGTNTTAGILLLMTFILVTVLAYLLIKIKK